MKTPILIVINKESELDSFTLDEDVKILIEKSSQCTILCTSEIGKRIKSVFKHKNINLLYFDLNLYFNEAKINLHLFLDKLRKEFENYKLPFVNPLFDSRSCLEFLRIYQKKLNKTNLLDLVSTICQLKACTEIQENNQILFLEYNHYDVCILRQVLLQSVSINITVNAMQLLPLKNTSFISVLKSFVQSLKLLLSLYRSSRSSNAAQMLPAKRNLAIVIDDIWHLYFSENLLQSTYFLDISSVLCPNFNIHWLVLINSRLSNSTPTDLKKALDKELNKQKNSIFNIINFIYSTLRLWSQLYILKSYSFLINKFTSSNIHGIMAFELDDLIGRVHLLLSNNIRKHAFEKSINDVIYIDRKPFSNVAKSIKNLNCKLNSFYVGLQHGITNINQLGYTFSEYEINQESSRNLLPDHMLVFGQNTYEFMVKNHFPQTRLSIGGSFVYTNLQPSLTCPIQAQNTNILLALQYPNEDLINLVNTIAESLINTKGYKIVIRPHPTYTESGSKAAKILINYGIAPNKILVSSNKLHDDLDSSDLLITQSSSIVFDYLKFSKPIFIYNGYSKYNNNYLFNEYECFEYFVSSRDLIEILANKQTKIKYALRYLFAERHVSSTTMPSIFLKTLIDSDS